ncbi:transcription termination factor 2, mitochondrial [Tachyglossus aculeatus]|uniref:transcription termination factor 2, mitochondrial n=1 Tax=Tachyglossus aculeatus TaxID=9261 RepID=UPI0018F3F449|nr:transcription termination factor 2, mitochondrial [Tachyglossus aculeatus]XP_038612037.1 transcription termination factor 2, mitochondrial [Tachyglossus aculeatus]XP_038612038.1 transcription termination factor 2, mitochondrial [Tachyglossus aculeatus]XP_038612039.1 transcription termination factor 2, mitochondrial [Tachyglossus aculeatus]XP_038612040.1 transcription termination factor 2, mitochondrial [Tachyglossus aculeatus]XP_038612041.1 transcription termination factor 2, mitochondrial 
MVRGIGQGIAGMLMMVMARSRCSRRTDAPAQKYGHFLQYSSNSADQSSRQENKRTVENLCRLSVDVKKIRRFKAWVLFKDVTYVEEIATLLQKMGASQTTIASILESCPEAILFSPKEMNAQKDLWQSVCRSEKELVMLIEQFPESFFMVKDHENQKSNVQFFQELGLRNIIISRFLTTAPSIFCTSVEKNKQIIRMLQDNYLNLGGSEANMKVWLLKLLSQNPFIFLNSSASIKETLEFLQKEGFTNSEVLKLLSNLKGFIFQLSPSSIKDSIFFSKTTFQCSDKDLKKLVLKCPALLYYSVPVLEERIKGLLKEGISVEQIRETPMVLELTPQIVQYRIRKLNALGYSVQSGNLDNLNGTKKEFEANYGKIQAKKERPLFNPVAPLNIED